MYRYAPSKKERKPGLGFARQRFNWITCLPRFRWIVARTATPYPKAYLVPKGSAVGNFDTPGNENRVRSGARFAFRDTKANCTSSCETARASSQDHVTKREVSPRYLTKLRERVDVRRERERERERSGQTTSRRMFLLPISNFSPPTSSLSTNSVLLLCMPNRYTSR